MNIEEKKQELIKAIKAKEISKNKLNPQSKGKYAGKLERGENVKDTVIERMYNNLMGYRDNNNPDKKKKSIAAIPVTTIVERQENNETVKELKSKVESLESTIEILGSKIEILENKNKISIVKPTVEKIDIEGSVIENINIEDTKSFFVNGFRVFYNYAVVKGNKYYAWYAIRNGKKIYIGKDKGKAESKINAWLVKHEA